MVELQKSLHTKEFGEAKRRCQIATNWFQAAMGHMREMASPTKSELEDAARSFFEKLRRDIDQPRRFPREDIAEAVNQNIAFSEEEMRALDRQLKANQFDLYVTKRADAMLADVGLEPDQLPGDLTLEANRLAARALREQMRYFIHQLERPHRQFVPKDETFRERRHTPTYSRSFETQAGFEVSSSEDKTLETAVQEFLAAKAKQGVGPSQIEEMSRLFRWLKEEVGPTKPLAGIRAGELRQFKDDLTRIDTTFRGRNSQFRERLTDDPSRQAKSATYGKYLASLKALFSWCISKGYIDIDPAAGLEFLVPRAEPKNTPEAFSKGELLALSETPLYAGYKSPIHLMDFGRCRLRQDHWWSAILLMHTGMRAGEMNQLLPGDFCFDDAIPHLKVRLEDSEGRQAKTVKNKASIRAVPLHARLLELGLREFVESKSSRPADRVFARFRMGPAGKLSDGLTRFWRDYLKEVGLWSPGRGTHVWRHTVVACMRRNGVLDDEIGSFVGHSGLTMTSRYGGEAPLELKAEWLNSLDYGFDVVEAFGGAFDPALHSIPKSSAKLVRKARSA